MSQRDLVEGGGDRCRGGVRCLDGECRRGSERCRGGDCRRGGERCRGGERRRGGESSTERRRATIFELDPSSS